MLGPLELELHAGNGRMLSFFHRRWDPNSSPQDYLTAEPSISLATPWLLFDLVFIKMGLLTDQAKVASQPAPEAPLYWDFDLYYHPSYYFSLDTAYQCQVQIGPVWDLLWVSEGLHCVWFLLVPAPQVRELSQGSSAHSGV